MCVGSDVDLSTRHSVLRHIGTPALRHSGTSAHRHWMFDVGCRMFGPGCLMSDVGFRIFGFDQTLSTQHPALSTRTIGGTPSGTHSALRHSGTPAPAPRQTLSTHTRHCTGTRHSALGTP
ncbi:MAG: hypothetical protein IPH45_11495 [Bacteroidales bacterium]|nr:hypothetical protein [Bacteroidales bacterium]